MRVKRIKRIEHCVYKDIDEFKEYNPDTNVQFNWRDSLEGQWVLADDLGVIQILRKAKLKHPNDSKNYKNANGYIRTVVGTFIIKDNSYMDTDFNKHPNRYTFSTNIKNTKDNIKKREKTTKKERAFSANVISGIGIAKSYMDAFTEENHDKARRKGLVLLKQDRVIKEIEQGALDVAKGLGIDHEYVLRTLKCLVDNSDDENIKLQSVKELGKVVGTLGTTTIKQREVGVFGMFDGFDPEILDSAKREALPAEKVE